MRTAHRPIETPSIQRGPGDMRRCVPRVIPKMVPRRKGPSRGLQVQPGPARNRHPRYQVPNWPKLRFRSKIRSVSNHREPGNHGPSDKHGAFQTVGHFRADLPADGSEQIIPRTDGLRAGIHQQEATGAIRVLGHAGDETSLPKRRSLLIAGTPAIGIALPKSAGSVSP